MSPSPLQYDVVVVGAGPTGLALANVLGGFGVSTLIVERNADTVGEPRAVSIDDESLRTLQYVGLLDAFRPRMVDGYGLYYFSARGVCFARVLPDVVEFGFPRRSAFRQPVLEAHLRHGLSRFACLTARFSTEVTSVAAAGHGARVALAGADGNQNEVSCRFVVACDGARSPIREALGITMVGSTYAQRWLIVDLSGSVDPFRHTRVYCDPRRPALALPGPDGTRRYEFMMMPAESAEAMLEEASVRALLARHSAADARLAIVRKVVYQFHARIAERWRAGPVFLAGDAAHLSPPFAGQGMNSGVRDAHNLGWKLAACVRGELGEQLLDTYESERKPHAWALIQMAVTLGRVMMPTSRANAMLVQSALRVLALYPPVRDYLMQMKYKPKPRFETGFVSGEAGGSLRGRMFPQPAVQRDDGSVVLLDDMLGQGFAVVEWHDHEQPVVPAGALLPLGARPLRVIPKDHRFVDRHDAASAVRDLTGSLHSAFSRARVRGVILRPDRYVAMALAWDAPADAAESGLSALARAVS